MKRKLTLLVCILMLTGIRPGLTFGQNSGSTPSQYNKPYKNVPDRRDVTIYQVNMRTFSKEGNFKGVTARLDSIKALGANVVYLMPVYPVGIVKTANSPYCVKDYVAINTEFGTLNDLRELVDGAHQRKMAVLLDWVGNHTSWDHAWITTHKDWYKQDSVGKIVSPQGWNDVVQLNFDNQDMRREMISAMKYWIYSANIDGFRCDYTDGPPVDFWKQAIDTLKKISNHRLLMLAEGKRPGNYTAGFDYNFGFTFFENLEAVYKKGKSAKVIDSLNNENYIGATGDQQIVRYLTNHDVNGSNGSAVEIFGGKKGSIAAFVVVAYMKGVPMIYNGQEVGLPYRLVFPFTSAKVDWTLNPDVTAEYKKIIAFRNASTAIRRGKLTSFTTDDVCAFTKQDGGKKVLVISNLRNIPLTFTLPAGLATTWRDAFTGAKTTLNSTIKLEPYSYLVLKN
ncbi:alpha-amylase family glycosyl hydrolase [Mucilaginibacter lacusdianchii]|uniref:alpha-amylase family glycosyl hydrolase n=1 Tax=Mucilaginibacter lacusdianchii TaxID=2684211 RepID=UPI00131E5D3B|nr:alpha-amylase family glycosyl hydrolase [Mucilaginibacter sp. JXJ CY 39]